ncbi:uncharacterized protein LOC134211970 isoform X2 [Armigeres subalbatus]
MVTFMDGFPYYAKNLFNDRSLADVTIIVDNDNEDPGCDATVSIRAHRVVLATMSDYFHTMFYGQFIEAKQSEVRLHGVPNSSFQHCIRFIYCGWDHTLSRLSCEDGIHLFKMAKMFLMDKKFQPCYTNWVISNITTWEKQLWSIFSMAVDYKLTGVENRCLALFSDIANESLFYESFREVPLAIVEKVLSCEKMNCTKVELAKAIKTWIRCNRIGGPVKEKLLKSIQSKNEELYKGEQVPLYTRLKKEKMDKARSNTDTPVDIAERYSSKLCFYKCTMLVGVTIVMSRNSKVECPHELSKGTINLEAVIKPKYSWHEPLAKRTAITVSYDWTKYKSRKVNIFFPEIKCCADNFYEFAFSFSGTNSETFTIRKFGPTSNDSVKAKESVVVCLFQYLSDDDDESRCGSCSRLRDSDSYTFWGHSSVGSYIDSSASVSSSL